MKLRHLASSLGLVFASGAFAQISPDIEVPNAFGTEPSLFFNKYASLPRLVLCYINGNGIGGNNGIYYSISDNLGDGWPTPGLLALDTRLDPTVAADPSTGAFWCGFISSHTERRFAVSKSNANLDGFLASQRLTPNAPWTDRPWLTFVPGPSASLLATYAQLNFATGKCNAWSKAGPTDGTDWGSSAGVQITVPGVSEVILPECYSFHVPNATDGQGYVYAMALKYWEGQETPAVPNEVRVFRSITGGQNWEQTYKVIANLQGSATAGFFSPRDRQMADFAITADCGGRPYVYAFFVRTYALVQPGDGFSDGGAVNLKWQALFCSRSVDRGANWEAPRQVFTLPIQDWPALFADVPGPAGGQAGGFYRIGRVWATVSPSGVTHVVWFDNKNGHSGIADHDKWRVMRAVSFDFGQSWLERAEVSSADSLGGHGTPKTVEQVYYAPPGEFLACDSDNANLFIAWPDSRHWLDGDPDVATIRFRRYGILDW